MKKVFQLIAVVLLVSAALTACSSSHSCPAYGKVNNVPAEKPV